ncbi:MULTISPECIES: RHS repeat domain-containing protein [unclassified Paenibacillus]|uniref:RHS repeat domain-containing protein n=1 Tax=unclassified Paenibacillus TaxID=185978 RepID=UPI00240703AC|nr:MULTISPECIES: RHS repeat domain-containing protein [unclassified Paenibacillus]MDF9845253.1 YD repeat-containing protein [Paenibacillus sp. PastF-2]MDF9851835.1 YD repeat-containing protein [Paenibacillus sp. PastM-2]MDF9858400.1 YD repeat-containing protein [Paenibacillus sp. PastF-1]MDH6483552.1 YD repeat-containing protein [Paenibacillus sp. PastH-2]MDH6511068.1 YD repeat-containing protein [Paenibacillus sp. PastM-3]
MNWKYKRNVFIFLTFLSLFFVVTLNSASALQSYFYDGNGRLVQESALTGETTRYSYDRNGNLLTKVTGEPYFQFLAALSAKQGENKWYYQTWNGTSYENMTWDAVGSRWKGKNDWNIIYKDWLHPDGNDTVMKWVAPQTGSIQIGGQVSKYFTNLQGDGVQVKIMKNSTQIWPSSGWQIIQGNDPVGVNAVANVNVTSGDSLYFVINQNGNYGFDATVWNPEITYIEKYTSAFGAEQGKNNWYYQIWNGTSYENMTWDPAGAMWRGKKDWNIIGKEWLHPEDGHDTALKWVAPQTGTVKISGKVAKHPVNLQGDGVRVKVMKNSAQIWPATGWQTIQGNDPIGVNIALNVNIVLGDSLYFVINQNGNYGFDATVWNPSVAYIK